MPSLESAQEQLTIRQGRIDLSFHQVVGEVFEYVLSDPRLFLSVPTSASTSVSSKGEPPSVSVKVSSAPHADAFSALQRGENDILIGWFDGSHGTYVDPFREDVVILGEGRDHSSVITPPIYTPYCIWGVPSYVPKAIVPSVQSLAEPSVAARFKMDSTSGKRIIQGIAPGAGISRFSKEMVESYSLAEHDWQFRSGSQEDCFGAFEGALEKEDWVVIPLWHPQYLHAIHPIRALEEPKKLLRPVDQARLVLRKDFLHTLSEPIRKALLSVLSRISLRNDAVTIMDKYVHVDKLSYRAAARRWIRENQLQVDSWFEDGHIDAVQRATQFESYSLPKEESLKPTRHYAIPTKAPTAAGAYSAYSLSSSTPYLIHTSFQLPWELDYNLPSGSAPKLAYVGAVSPKKGSTVTEVEGIAAVRICALNLLAQLRDAADGDLARIQLLRLDGYVATADTDDDSVNVPRILDAASLLIKHVLRPTQGSHARTALVLQKNPLNVPTMLGAVAELRW